MNKNKFHDYIYGAGVTALVLMPLLLYIIYHAGLDAGVKEAHPDINARQIVSTNVRPDGVVCVTYFDYVRSDKAVSTECPEPITPPNHKEVK